MPQMTFLNDPTQKERRPITSDAGDIENIGNAQQYARRALAVARAGAAKFGYQPQAVPVVNRANGSMRVWNLTGNATAYGEVLCGQDWRIATPEEWAADQKRVEEFKRAEARKRLRYEEAAVNKIATDISFQRDVDLSNADDATLAALGADELAALERRIAAMKASQKKAK